MSHSVLKTPPRGPRKTHQENRPFIGNTLRAGILIVGCDLRFSFLEMSVVGRRYPLVPAGGALEKVTPARDMSTFHLAAGNRNKVGSDTQKCLKDSPSRLRLPSK